MERLSDERLRGIAWGGNSFLASRLEEMAIARELLDLRVAVHELRQNIGIIGAELADKGAKLAAYKLLTEENEKLRARCTWLQERRAVLRKLVSSRWSKRREVRRLRAKLAAGPVMPEVPSESVQIVIIDTVNNAIAGRGNWSCYGLYVDIRTALLKEQSR